MARFADIMASESLSVSEDTNALTEDIFVTAHSSVIITLIVFRVMVSYFESSFKRNQYTTNFDSRRVNHCGIQTAT